MFARQLNELKQRQLALRLRNIELRAELQTEARRLLRPAHWFGLAGGAAGLLLSGLRLPRRLAQIVGWAKLGLRLARLFRGR